MELTGLLQGEGDGIVYSGCGDFSVTGLAINGAPGSGVLIASPLCDFGTATAVVQRSYIGTDPTAIRAVGNQRGITVDSAGKTELLDNIISGNVRSGLFLQRGRTRVPVVSPGGRGRLTGCTQIDAVRSRDRRRELVS